MPDWRDAAIARVRASHDPDPPIRKRRRANRGDVEYASAFGRTLTRANIHLAPEFITLLDRAARVKNVNRSTYIRRSLAVQIAADLLMDIREVLAWSPGPGRYARHQDSRGSADTGEQIEDWCMHPGCDGRHLSGG